VNKYCEERSRLRTRANRDHSASRVGYAPSRSGLFVGAVLE